MTICFQNQWKTEDGSPLAVPHVTTTNKSFLRTCQLFKQMGVQNYAFPLALYDPDLLHVNVHDLEENTPENERLRTKVQIEARRNGWYFLRECIRIYEQGGSPVSFRLDRGSTAMAWCFFNGIDYTGMQPRQAQPETSIIKTPVGISYMRDMKVGSVISAPDGTSTNVIGVYPLGIREVFKITLENGSSTRCCKDHLWRVYSKDNDQDWDILSLEEILRSEESSFLIPVMKSKDKWSLYHIASIEHDGYEKVQCIEVDHPDHLYITDDNIVSHNTGKTVCALSLSAWVMYSSGYEFQMGMMAKDNKLREENVKRVRAFGENLPKWWVAEDKILDKKNTTELFYHAMRTHYVTFVAQKDKNQADLQARGASPPVFHFDEFEFCVNIGTSYSTILASTNTARQNAKRNGKPHSNIITTTAGDPMKPECKEAAKLLEGAMPFTEKLYDVKNYEELHQIVEATSPQKMIIGVFSHLQLGYDNKWLRDTITRNRMTRDQVMRDYLNRRVSIQEKPIIPENVLSLITASEREPVYPQILTNKFLIYWYIPKHVVESQSFKEKSIIVGCDSSEMIGRDATTLIGVDPQSLETIFTFHASEGNINVVGVMIADLMMRFPKMVWVPENKSSGTSLIDIVSMILRREGHNPFNRIFNLVVNNRHEEAFAKIDIRDGNLLDTQVKRFFGIKTDKTKREELYSSTLLEACSRAASRIKDRVLIQQLSSLTNRNGRVDHAVGGHDDDVVAWLMAMWFILSGKNHEVYGIRRGLVLSNVHTSADDKSRVHEERQLYIRNKIEDLSKAWKSQSDPSQKKRIEADLELWKSLVDSSSVPTPVTADELSRDPRRYTDPVTAKESRPQITSDQIEHSLKMMLNIR